jgi:phospholipid N-methyltransferase
MNGNELAERRSGVSLKRKIAEALGPAGVFFRGFLEHPRMVGSIIPSSRNTILKMLAPVKWNECRLFVEYGPGVGTFCRPVLDRLPRDGALVVIDTNPLFIDYLKRTIRDSRFHPVLGSAEDVEAIVQALGYEKADYVLSGLPFSTLPEGVGQAIAAATHRVVRQGGAFLTYQFRASARDLTARYFKRIETGFAWWNIPPCLLCWGWQEG